MLSLSGLRTKTILVSAYLVICISASFAWCSSEQTKDIGTNKVNAKITNPDSPNQVSDESVLTDVLGRLDKLRFSEEQSELYNKWNEYLVSRTHFDNNEYLSTIMKLGVDFAGSVKRLNECIRLEEKKEKQYSAAWLPDLQKKFGKEYILKNRKSIGFMILGILSYHQSGECIEARKAAIYREAQYTYILRRYVKYFLEYVDTLDKAKKEEIKNKAEYAKSIQEIPVDPLKELIAHEVVVYELQVTALKSRKDFEPELREFLMQHPSFAKSFDIGKALKDLREYK